EVSSEVIDLYRIMIVEDDDKIANILKQYMEKYQYQVIRVLDYQGIKKEFVEAQPDLVLLDINLPQYDGFYWWRQIRIISNVTIFNISARVGEMDQVMAIENGGDDYITKPFGLEIVMAKIKSALRRSYGEYSSQTSDASLTNIFGMILDARKNA